MEPSDPSNPLTYTEYTPSATNLFVNFLPARIRDAELFGLFAPYGNVESSRVMVDNATNQSKCFGFVKFSTNDEARKAIQALNGCTMENKVLVVRFANANTPTAIKGTPSNTIYIKHLPLTMTEAELRLLFVPYGTVEETKLLLDHNTKLSRGAGFIRYASVEDSEKALALDGCTLQGSTKPLIVRYADTEQEKIERKIKIAKKLKTMRYNPYQPLGQAPYPYQSTPYAPQSSYPGYPAPSYPSSSSSSIPPPQDRERTLFVFNVPNDADDMFLYRTFGPFGAIESVRLVRDPATQKLKGFGFVNMVRPEDAYNAIQAVNGTLFGDKIIQVSFRRKS